MPENSDDPDERRRDRRLEGDRVLWIASTLVLLVFMVALLILRSS